MSKASTVGQLDKIDFDKPYCGNCGAQNVPLRKLPYRGGDDPQHVCKDREACHARTASRQS